MLEIERQSISNKLVAGTRWVIREQSNIYNVDSYKLVYIFSTSAGFVKSFETIADDNAHLLIVNPSDTSVFLSGYYNVSIQAKSLSNNDLIYHVANVTVFVNASSGVNATLMSYYVQMVERLEKTILALANRTMTSVTLDGITYNYNDIEKLERLLNYYRDKINLNSKLKNKVLVTFVK